MKRKVTIIFMLLTTLLLSAQEIKYISAVELNIREGAGKNYNVIAKAHENEKVTIISEKGNWSEIRTETGTEGYVSSKFLKTNSGNFEFIEWDENKTYILIGVILIFLLYKIFGSFNYSRTTRSQNYDKPQRVVSQKTIVEEKKTLTSTSANWKYCSTCEFWAGSRRVSHWRDRSEHESRAKGECAGGGWNRIQKSADSTCSSWKKWGVLK